MSPQSTKQYCPQIEYYNAICTWESSGQESNVGDMLLYPMLLYPEFIVHFNLLLVCDIVRTHCN